jgi:hypothetical protein
MKVIFKFDKEKDAFNIFRTCNNPKWYGEDFTKSRDITKKTINICKGKKFNNCKKELIKEREKIYASGFMEIYANALNLSWKKIEKEYFNRLEKITKRKFPHKKVSAYLTTIGMCWYQSNPKAPNFDVNYFSSINNCLLTAGHELMHIHLHNTDWWKKVEKNIGYNKTHDLKEALTVLLNLEFSDLWIFIEFGYPNHIRLREFISKEWVKEKDFDKLTDNCIKWIKKNGIK